MGQHFVGVPADAEMGNLVTMRVSLPRGLVDRINTLLNLTEHQNFSQFAMHAIWALLDGYARAGYFDPELNAELAYEKVIRGQAEWARRRQSLDEDFHKWDFTLDQACVRGDIETIDNHLKLLEGFINLALTEGEKQEVRQAAAKSQSIQKAVRLLAEWPAVLPLEVSGRVERWRTALEDWIL